MEESKRKELFDSWHKLAYEDLEMVHLALSKKLLLQASYHCQQFLEKELKGLIILALGQNPPYSHDLVKLSLVLKDKFPVDDLFLKQMASLNPYYIQARYPSYQANLSKALTEETVGNFLKIIDKVIKWQDQNKV